MTSKAQDTDKQRLDCILTIHVPVGITRELIINSLNNKLNIQFDASTGRWDPESRNLKVDFRTPELASRALALNAIFEDNQITGLSIFKAESDIQHQESQAKQLQQQESAAGCSSSSLVSNVSVPPAVPVPVVAPPPVVQLVAPPPAVPVPAVAPPPVVPGVRVTIHQYIEGIPAGRRRAIFDFLQGVNMVPEHHWDDNAGFRFVHVQCADQASADQLMHQINHAPPRKSKWAMHARIG